MAIINVHAPLYWDAVIRVHSSYQVWVMGPGEYWGDLWRIQPTGSMCAAIRMGVSPTGAATRFFASVYLVDSRETPDEVIDHALLRAGLLRGPNGDLHHVKWGSANIPMLGTLAYPRASAQRLIPAAMADNNMGVWLHTCYGHDAQPMFDEARELVDEYLRNPVLLEAHLESKFSTLGTTRREAAAGYTIDRSGWGTSHVEPLPLVVRPPCPNGINHPRHYWQDGSCRCDDRLHHAVMCQLWWTIFDVAKLPPIKRFHPRFGPFDCITPTVRS